MICVSCRPCRWTVAGPSGLRTGRARGAVAVGCSWPGANAPTPCRPTGAPTARASASSTAPATWSPALPQVRAGARLGLRQPQRNKAGGPTCLLFSVPGKSFREEQCEAFNGYSHSTNRLTASISWVPKYSGVSPRDKCKLICRANGTGYFYVLAPKVGENPPGSVPALWNGSSAPLND